METERLQTSPVSGPQSRKRKARGWKDRIFVMVGFSLGCTVSVLVSSFFPTMSPLGIDEFSLPRFGCNCSRIKKNPIVEASDEPVHDAEDAEYAEEDEEPDIIERIQVRDPRPYLKLDGSKNNIRDFDPAAKVVIVTKIQGKLTVGALNQSLCLLTYAYNHRVNYDIVVFSATEIRKKQLDLIRSTVYPANVTFVIDNPGLHTMVDALNATQKTALLNRCNVSQSSELDWLTRCEEKTSMGTTNMHLQYTWQAWFRTIYLWEHPALQRYKYMIWADTDAFCTKVWQEDPIAIMRRNNMVILFDNFPMGTARGSEWPKWTKKAFGKPICSIKLSKSGHLRPSSYDCVGRKVKLNQIHGFFHITDLDFYRSKPVMNWQRIMMGDSTFSRFRDDQIAVTVPAAALAANRSWSMRSIGLNLSVVHDFLLDGQKSERIGGFMGFWKNHANRTFPEAYGKCNAVSPG